MGWPDPVQHPWYEDFRHWARNAPDFQELEGSDYDQNSVIDIDETGLLTPHSLLSESPAPSHRQHRRSFSLLSSSTSDTALRSVATGRINSKQRRQTSHTSSISHMSKLSHRPTTRSRHDSEFSALDCGRKGLVIVQGAGSLALTFEQYLARITTDTVP